jgi:hypothetical protein
MDFKVKTTRKDFYRYKSDLIDAGYRQLGHGAFASVWAKPYSKTVLKIGYVDNNESYLQFVKKSVKKNNPYFPKFFAITIFEHKGSPDYFVLEMERLRPLPRKVDFCFDVTDDNKYISDPVGQYAHALLTDLHLTQRVAQRISNKLKIKLTPVNQEARAACSKVLDRLLRKWRGDFHDRNIMLRKEKTFSTLVFTDPVWDADAI